jgi:hypothetical protein
MMMPPDADIGFPDRAIYLSYCVIPAGKRVSSAMDGELLTIHGAGFTTRSDGFKRRFNISGDTLLTR